MSKTMLLLIDIQNDFCNPPAGAEYDRLINNACTNWHVGRPGALSVPNGIQCCKDTATMILKGLHKIDDIILTLDSHHMLHISHPVCWIDQNNQHPAPFTAILPGDVTGSNPKWRASIPAFRNRFTKYVNDLHTSGGIPHVIWPPHCLIGTPGHCVNDLVMRAVLEWEVKRKGCAIKYTKGSWLFTEHFGALMAQVPDPEEPGTGLSTEFLAHFDDCDKIFFAGQASTHCVPTTVRQIADNFGESNIKKLYYVRDLCSPVPGFEHLEEEFVKSMVARGMHVVNSKSVF